MLLVVVETQFFVLDEVSTKEEYGETDDGAGEEEERGDFGSVDYFLDLWMRTMRTVEGVRDGTVE